MQVKILVADDSATDRMLIKNMLSDCCILTACDGVETVRMLEKHDDINLLILDLNMPNMNGFQVLEYLKKNDRYKNLRTIILTIYDELDNEIKGLQLGAVDYIRKPVHMASLRARIDVHVALLRAEAALKQQLKDQTLTLLCFSNKLLWALQFRIAADPDHSDRANVRINSRFEQITGRTKEELIHLGWAKITHPDDLEKDINNFNKLLSGEINMYSMDKRYIRPDGSIVWVHMIVAPLLYQMVSFAAIYALYRTSPSVRRWKKH